MTPEDEARRAGEANQILNSPMFQEARRDLEAQLTQLRRNVPISNQEMHTRLILMEQVAGHFFGYFDQIAQTGKLAEITLDQRRQWNEKLKERLRMYATMGRNSI